jgi:hypothetical protein
VPLFPVRKRSRSNDLLLLSLGATVGVVAGALLVDRIGGLDRLFSRARRGRTAALDTPEPELAEPPYGLHDADGSFDDDHDLDYADFEDEEDLAQEALELETPIVSSGSREGSDARARRPIVPDVLTLEARVLEAFHNDPVLVERAIDIGAIAPGVIELTGWVHTPEEVRHALIIARGVPDVQHVVDQLAVRQPTRNRRATDRLGLALAEELPDPRDLNSRTRAD